jgi:hypothetical protein
MSSSLLVVENNRNLMLFCRYEGTIGCLIAARRLVNDSNAGPEKAEDVAMRQTNDVIERHAIDRIIMTSVFRVAAHTENN